MKIKTPPKRLIPYSMLGFGSIGKTDARELMHIELAARDQQWLELVGPVVEALQKAKNSLVAFKFMPEPSNAWEGHDEENLAAVDAALRAITEEQE